MIRMGDIGRLASRVVLSALALALLTASGPASAGGASAGSSKEAEQKTRFHFSAQTPEGTETLVTTTFVKGIDNPFFPLVPGTEYHYQAAADVDADVIVVIVTHLTRKILGVTATALRSREYRAGLLKEESDTWYAQDKDGNVWRLAEDSREFEGGQVVSTAGSWEAGKDDAMPGIFMPGKPKIGDTFRQEKSPGVSEDIGEIVSLESSATVPHGTFTGCLETVERSPLEPDTRKHRYWARGVGLIRETTWGGVQPRLELMKITRAGAPQGGAGVEIPGGLDRPGAGR